MPDLSAVGETAGLPRRAMTGIINPGTEPLAPGTEPLAEASEGHAAENMDIFASDLEAHRVFVCCYSRAEDDDRDGRYGFTLHMLGRCDITVRMPGLTLERVRYLGPPQNIWDFPRLYINGSSWVWRYALNACIPDGEA